MKKSQLILLLSFMLLLYSTTIVAQCNDLAIDNISNPGPYNVETITEIDGIRNGPFYFGATIYYPTNKTELLASIAIVPGFTALPSSVEDWGPFYASHGIVCIIIGTNSIYDFPEARAIALLDALETIKQENSRASSPLKDLLDLNKLAVSGWSMGGGGAQRAAVIDNTIAAVVALCPYLNDPQLNHSSPVLIFSGENDAIAPPAQQANIHYNQTPSTTNKVLFEIKNGNHYVANSPNGGDGAVGRLALSWITLYLEGNNCYCSLLKDHITSNPIATSVIKQNFECESLAVNNEELAIKVYPNPVKNFINVQIYKNVHYKVFSTLGQRLSEGYLTGDTKQIDLSQFSKGLYYLNIEGHIIKLIKNN